MKKAIFLLVVLIILTCWLKVARGQDVKPEELNEWELCKIGYLADGRMVAMFKNPNEKAEVKELLAVVMLTSQTTIFILEMFYEKDGQLYHYAFDGEKYLLIFPKRKEAKCINVPAGVG